MGDRSEARLLRMAVHDLRNALNAIVMATHVIQTSMPRGNPEIQADIGMLAHSVENAKKQVQTLGDYCQLLEFPPTPAPASFQPARLLREMEQDQPPRAEGSRTTTWRLLVGPGTPDRVQLDPPLTRLALSYALSNAQSAARGRPILVVLDGHADRWNVSIEVEAPPESTVQAGTIAFGNVERLTGSAAERRGMDLGVVARLAELMGGNVRLDLVPGERSKVILDWPVHLA